VRLFRESRGHLQHYAAWALGVFGDARAVPVLWELLAGPLMVANPHPHGGLRHAILQSLAILRHADAIPLLCAELAPPHDAVAREAAQSLGLFGEVAIGPLIDAQAHPEWRPRVWATLALERVGGPGVVAPVERALADESARVREQAAESLGELGDARVIPSLNRLIDDPDVGVREAVAESLRRLGPRRGPKLPEPGPNRHVFNLYADYNQFYLGDGDFAPVTDTADYWSDAAQARKLAVSPPGMVAVSTARYDFVPVVVEVLAEPPPLDLTGWDHVVEASLELPSGRLAIDGCLDYDPGRSDYLEVAPGTYRLRILYAGQQTVDEDWYQVVLWPQSPYEPVRVIMPPV
jgi:hypothetical protein